MTDREKFEAFKQHAVSQNEAAHGAEIRAQYGDAAMDAANARILSLTPEEYDTWKQLEEEILSRLTAAVRAGASPDSEEGAAIAALHRQWLNFSGQTYTAAAHRSLAQCIRRTRVPALTMTGTPPAARSFCAVLSGTGFRTDPASPTQFLRTRTLPCSVSMSRSIFSKKPQILDKPGFLRNNSTQILKIQRRFPPMKYVVVLGDGMADEPIDQLGGKTPLAYADTPMMGRACTDGEVGLAKTIPDSMKAAVTPPTSRCSAMTRRSITPPALRSRRSALAYPCSQPTLRCAAIL